MLKASTRPIARTVHVLPPFDRSTLLVTGGSMLLAISALLPWLVVFGGVQSVRGIDVPVVLLAEGAGALAMGVWLLGNFTVRSPALWWTSSVASSLCVVYGAIEIERLATFIASPGPTGALLRPQAGPGAPLFILGSLLVLAATVTTRRQNTTLPLVVRRNAVLALALFGAGWIHLSLTGEHLGEDTLLGIGFALAALAQLTLAVASVRTSRNSIYLLSVAVNVGLMILYAYNAIVGLPLGDSGHVHGDGPVSISLGRGEPVDLYGIACEALQALAIVLAFVRLTPNTGRTSRHSPS